MTYRPRILFIDAYDSFSNNIISLLETSLGVDVLKISIHDRGRFSVSFLKEFVAVVCGPGPGSPAINKDVGLFNEIWTLDDNDVIPTLGICLGFQSLAFAFGGDILQLPRPRHGLETAITTSSDSIFAGISEVETVQYHSLHICLGHNAETECRDEIWQPSAQTPQLLPLAWDFTPHHDKDSVNPAAILMAVRHTKKPFFGVQFHPESICSNETAHSVLSNWWNFALNWHLGSKGRYVAPRNFHDPHTYEMHPESSTDDIDRSSGTVSRSQSPSDASTAPSSVFPNDSRLQYVTLDCGSLTVPLVCDILRLHDAELVILDSEMRQMQALGEFSIIGLIEADTVKMSYCTGDNFVTVGSNNVSRQVDLERYNYSIFTFLKEYLQDHFVRTEHETAFCGGFMGYATYEAGLETLKIPTKGNSTRPDICFAFVERSIVLDHVRRKVYIQSIKHEDIVDGTQWLAKVENDLMAKVKATSDTQVAQSPPKGTYACQFPLKKSYQSKIRSCQDYIRRGESYEICLTDQTTVIIEDIDGKSRTPWQRYTVQRQLNKAPFAAYIRLGPLTLLSTSPERFICWSRPSLKPASLGTGGVAVEVTTCQFRPIKGTVQKSQTLPNGSTRTVSLAEATAVLSTPKERAENLMIVDLIRHDLHGVAGSGNVSVPDLMVVEEYETVYQLVSVIEGRLYTRVPCIPFPRTLIGISSSHPANEQLDEDYRSEHRHARSGIDVLAAALPPGSMTGAPKLRACELLRDIEEQRPRSIYSGVAGYMCVTGKGDFSVVIRSAYRWDDEVSHRTAGGAGSGVWHIGAGGAITDLSTEVGEWDEMLGKLQGTLRSFAPGAEASLP